MYMFWSGVVERYYVLHLSSINSPSALSSTSIHHNFCTVLPLLSLTNPSFLALSSSPLVFVPACACPSDQAQLLFVSSIILV